MEKFYLGYYISKTCPQFVKSFFIDIESISISLNICNAKFNSDSAIFSLECFFKFIRFDLNLCFQVLLDLWCIDCLSQNFFKTTDFLNRFELMYYFSSIFRCTNRIFIFYRLSANFTSKVHSTNDSIDSVESVFSIFPSAGWLEREIWDLFGIFFRGNPDLRRILTDYGFVGHPMRKDFPVFGYQEIRYNDEVSRIVYEPVCLDQSFRVVSNINSSWC